MEGSERYVTKSKNSLKAKEEIYKKGLLNSIEMKILEISLRGRMKYYY
jgi:hypothetical protein